ncbi:hypothetical protein CEXT_337641 [Caerostris extrusa]|uniref:Uncharacterized protein n=1 Tax=Caerostris extrusa TaxID=172846 RepID=A0AAV4QIM6_CAEEX|nr:hypothetical protein CEXT_337641 [Caerostris extrusa]
MKYSNSNKCQSVINKQIMISETLYKEMKPIPQTEDTMPQKALPFLSSFCSLLPSQPTAQYWNLPLRPCSKECFIELSECGAHIGFRMGLD